MKKLMIFSLFFIASSAFSDTLIFNMSEKNNLQVSYRICDVDMKTQEKKCDESKTVQIDSSNKNYLIIKPNKNLDTLHYERLEILSAMEKNSDGNLVSQSNYFNKYKQNESNCSAMIASSYENDQQFIAEVITLNDMKQSPYIVCSVDAGTAGFLKLA